MLSDKSHHSEKLPPRLAALFLLALIGLGCDQPPAPPPPDTQPAADTTPPAPTTRDIASEPTKPLELIFVPITVQVPDGWTVNREGPADVLEGPIPHPFLDDTASLKLGPPLDSSQTEYQAFVGGAQMEMKNDPTRYLLSGPKQVGNLIILDERQYPKLRATHPTSVPAGYSPLFNWTVWIFVPHRTGFDRYDLSFLGLDVNTYNANKEFLQKIIDSIQYDPQAEGPMNGLGG